MSTNDELFVPVDSVIYHIFEELTGERNLKFEKVNNFMKNINKKEDIEIWDDLWFWGFITQQNVKVESKKQNEKTESKRVIVDFNEGKYWSILETPKDKKTVAKIRIKCLNFLNLLGAKETDFKIII